MKQFTLFLLSLLLLTLFSTCNSGKNSKHVDQRLIYPVYNVSYSAHSSQLTASVSFRENNETGTPILLSKNCLIAFNGIQLPKNTEESTNNMTDYFRTFNSFNGSLDSLSFIYVNDDKDSLINLFYLNTIQIENNVSLSFDSLSIIIPFKGKPLTDDEYLLFSFYQNDKLIADISPNVLDNNQIELTPEMMIELLKGQYTLYVIRNQYITSLNSLERGGSFMGKYVSSPVSATIK